VEEKKEKALDRKRKWKDILDVKEELAKSDPQLLTVHWEVVGVVVYQVLTSSMW
jgi:hypothetical protein